MSKRAGYAVLAWAAATATAMGVVWAGLDSVLPAAVESPHVATVAAWPVQEAASTAGVTPSAVASPSPVTGSSSAAAPVTRPASKASAAATTAAAPSAAGSTSASGSSGGTGASGGTSSGTEKRYTTPGGTAVLTLYSDHATLDAAIPASGFSAQSWTNSDMLEVEFSPSDAGTVYEVIATWNGTSPQVSTYAVGG